MGNEHSRPMLQCQCSVLFQAVGRREEREKRASAGWPNMGSDAANRGASSCPQTVGPSYVGLSKTMTTCPPILQSHSLARNPPLYHPPPPSRSATGQKQPFAEKKLPP